MSTAKFMHTSIEKLMQFLRWWKQGLRAPWQRWRAPTRIVLSTNQGLLTIVRLDAQGRAQHEPLPLSKQLANNRRLHQARIYLLVPPEYVMATPVGVEQRLLHTHDIAAELLPFEPNELVAGMNAARDHLYSVLHTDVQRAVSEARLLLTEHASVQSEWALRGVAFATPTGWVTSDTTLPADPSNQEHPQPSSFARAPIMKIAQRKVTYCALGLVSVWVAALLVQQSALHEQQRLHEQLTQLTTQTPVPEAHPFAPVLTYARARSAQDTLRVLDSLAMSLRADDVLSQLILTNENMVLDASANDASGLQLALREVAVFNNVEFVAGITAQAASTVRVANPQERFRLKVGLSTAPFNDAEAPE